MYSRLIFSSQSLHAIQCLLHLKGSGIREIYNRIQTCRKSNSLTDYFHNFYPHFKLEKQSFWASTAASWLRDTLSCSSAKDMKLLRSKSLYRITEQRSTLIFDLPVDNSKYIGINKEPHHSNRVLDLYLCSQSLSLPFSINKAQFNNKSELIGFFTGVFNYLNRKCTSITTKFKAEFHTEVVKIFDIDIILTPY